MHRAARADSARLIMGFRKQPGHVLCFHYNGAWTARGLVVEVLLYVHRNRRLIRDGAQDDHLDFHTAPEL